jgi:hypothetical protein
MRFGVAIAVLLLAGAARADGEDEKEDKEEKEEKIVPNAMPFVGGDSDVGFGGGAFAALTRVTPGRKPRYVWRVDAAFLTTFKLPSGGRPFRVPYQDYWATLSLPHLFDDAMRLEVRPSYTLETTQRYYGIGNAAPDTSPEGPNDPNDAYYQYGRIHPTLLVRARLRLGGGLFLLVGNSYTRNVLDVHPISKLSRDGVAGPPVHGVNFFEYGLELDRRDDDIVTTRGTWHQLKLRLSPGGTTDMPYRYAQLDAIARGYAPLGRRVVLAGRAVFDAQIGDPPFYELARYEDTFAIGGTNGVRGVPGQRYYGRVKAFGNFETRVRIVDFRAFGKPFTLGTVALLDAGRVWTELGQAHPDLDGTSLGLKWGVGGGLRLVHGTTFVVRAELAWSPDAHPIAGYFAAGDAF